MLYLLLLLTSIAIVLHTKSVRFQGLASLERLSCVLFTASASEDCLLGLVTGGVHCTQHILSAPCQAWLLTSQKFPTMYSLVVELHELSVALEQAVN